MPNALDTDIFDLFSGIPLDATLWIEWVEGFERAKQRLHEFERAVPGSYFMFHAETTTVVYLIRGPKKVHKAADEPQSGAA